MSEIAIVSFIVLITLIIMGISGYRTITSGSFCSKCKINKKKK